ncbi:MAG: hypothetical protein L7S72_06920, partial [Flavobacteriales bacterium]|nr:hypothetical protein [Flavobacteriales bacterium]
ITSALDNSSAKNIKKHNSRPINELQQGMLLLQKRRNDIHKLSKSPLMESMSSSMKKWTNGENNLKNLSKKELDALKQMETDFNKDLSSYSQEYKNFMENYYNAVKQVETCKTNCLQNIPTSDPQYSYKRQACSAGCDIKGPYVSKCEDTFTKSRLNQESCSAAVQGKCIDGLVQLGADSYVDDMNRADSNNITIRKGCCACGGGGGGPPSAKVRGKTIKNCNNLPAAFGYSGSQGDIIKNACLTAPIASPESNANLYKQYEKLTSSNKGLIEKAEKIFNKITQFNKLNGDLDMTMKSQRDQLKDNLDEYSTVYLKLQNSKTQGTVTIDAQVEDIDLKESNQMFQLGIWGSLAILLLLVTLDKLKK